MTATTTPATGEALVNERLEQLLAEHDPATTPTADFLGAQFDAGLAWVHFPEGKGGLGLSPKFQEVIDRRLIAAGAPRIGARNPIAGMAAPTVLTYGSEEQHQHYLRPMFQCRDI